MRWDQRAYKSIMVLVEIEGPNSEPHSLGLFTVIVLHQTQSSG